MPILVFLIFGVSSFSDSSVARKLEKKPNFGNYLSGMLAEKEGKINEAIEYYQSVVETDRENVELLRKLHLLSLKDGQFKNAVKYATKIKEHTHDPLSQTTLLVNALSENQFVDAILILESIPDSALSEDIKKIILAWCFAGQKNFNLAMNALEDIEDSEKNLLIKNLNIALLLDAFGKKDLAKIKFDMILSNNFFSAERGLPLRIYEVLLDYYSRSNNDQMLQGIFRKMAENNDHLILNSEFDPILFGNSRYENVNAKNAISEIFFDISMVYRRSNEIDMFQLFSTYTLQLNDRIPLLFIIMAEFFETNGQYGKAVTLYSKLRHDKIYHPYAELRAAICLYNLKRIAESINKLYALTSIKSISPQVFTNLGNIFRLEKKYEESIEAYSEALERISTLEKKHWSLFYNRGISYERNKQWEKAEDDFIRSLNLDPNQPEVINYVAYSWIEMGVNLEKALEMLKTATTLQPDDGYIIDSLGWAHFRLGNLDEAILQLERAVQLAPLDPTINFHLGDVYIQIGRKRQAYFQWLRALKLDPDPDLEVKIKDKLQQIDLKRIK